MSKYLKYMRLKSEKLKLQFGIISHMTSPAITFIASLGCAIGTLYFFILRSIEILDAFNNLVNKAVVFLVLVAIISLFASPPKTYSHLSRRIMLIFMVINLFFA